MSIFFKTEPKMSIRKIKSSAKVFFRSSFLFTIGLFLFALIVICFAAFFTWSIDPFTEQLFKNFWPIVRGCVGFGMVGGVIVTWAHN